MITNFFIDKHLIIYYKKFAGTKGSSILWNLVIISHEFLNEKLNNEKSAEDL